ncbi:MAG: glycosyltransferase family protein [Mariniphaga sp.]
MKVLYAIQGTGNGHISRAREIIPTLGQYCDYDILISGTQCDVELSVPVKFKFKGLSFTFGKKGGIDLWSTTVNASLPNMKREMNQLNVEDYDLVINDFEPISAWACRSKGVPCISLSHQGSLLSAKVPMPLKKDYFGRFVIRNYAPANAHFGFHFQPYDEFIFTPVIRKQVREIGIEELDYYTVYLPAYDDQRLVEKLSHFGNIRWHIFSKHAKKPYFLANISVFPITNDEFVADMAGSNGVLCGAGFETPAEALYLKKKLMVVPMKGQYEQKCNAAALELMGVPVIKSLKEKHFGKIGQWLESDQKVEVDYPDQTQKIIGMLFASNLKTGMQKNI